MVLLKWNTRNHLYLLQTNCKLIDYTLVVHGSLIVHAPGSVGELQATLVDQLFYNCPDGLRLLVPPFGEEGGLNLDEATIGVLDQLRDHGVDNVLDSSMLYVVLVAIEVLINRLKPSHIVVGMGHQVYVDHV